MAQTSEDLLKEYLDDNTSFYKSIKSRYRYRYTKFPKDDPSTTIIRLDEEDYDFKQEHFDKFIKCVSYNKGNSFICYNNHNANSLKAIRIMFTKFTPSEK